MAKREPVWVYWWQFNGFSARALVDNDIEADCLVGILSTQLVMQSIAVYHFDADGLNEVGEKIRSVNYTSLKRERRAQLAKAWAEGQQWEADHHSVHSREALIAANPYEGGTPDEVH